MSTIRFALVAFASPFAFAAWFFMLVGFGLAFPFIAVTKLLGRAFKKFDGFPKNTDSSAEEFPFQSFSGFDFNENRFFGFFRKLFLAFGFFFHRKLLRATPTGVR